MRQALSASKPKESRLDGAYRAIRRDWKQHRVLYFMVLPVLAFYIIFCYVPMFGTIIAFKQYSPGLGFLASPWVGLENFKYFFSSSDFLRILRNTLTLSVSLIIFGFPAPIILALLFNEIQNVRFKKAAQTVSYMPHFISLVVICGLIKTFVADGGFIQEAVAKMTGQTVGSLLNNSNYFTPIYVLSDVWQSVGWGSIIYLAALSGIDQQLYEAAKIDGAGKFKQIIHVTLPGIEATIIIMLILRIGKILTVGYEKIILLYSPLIYEKADVISTYVYRMGFEGQDWSYSAAVGLFNSVVSFLIIIAANTISKRVSETSLW